MTVPTSTKQLKPLLFLALLLAAVALVWLIVTKSLTAYLAEVAPEAALRLNPTSSPALLRLASSALDRLLAAEQARASTDKAAAIKAAPSARDADPSSKQIRLWARTAITHDPLNARAMRILGQLAGRAKKQQEAVRFMRAATRRSLREAIAVYMMMRESHAKQDHAQTLSYADAILRSNPSAAMFVVPTLARLAEDDGAKEQLSALLARNPPWRAQFFSILSNAITDARTPLFLLLKLKDTAHPATIAEIRSYLAFLIARKFYGVAYYTWLQFLPREQLRGTGLLFNGSFEISTSGLPFDWRIVQGSGATIDIAPRPDQQGRKALFIDFGPGRVQLGSVSQMMLLAPGSYRLRGKYRGRIIGRRGLVWRVRCLGARPKQIAESAMVVGSARVWTEFDTDFTVSDDCRAQTIRLVLDARSASERFVTGNIWYDELAIVRQ